MQSNLVSIVILNHNGRQFLPNCLASVSRQHFDSYEVILVDNASEDDSVAFVKEHFPDVRIIQADRNLGFAGGNNLGVGEARGRLVVLLNNDVVVEPGWLQGLVDAVQLQNVAVASSLIKTEGVPEEYYKKNGTINFLGHNIMGVFEEPTEIFFAGGASLIFKRDILGLPFDPDYVVYAEDVYLSLRARFMGYNVRHTNASRVKHLGSATAKKKPRQWLTFYQERNRLLNTLLFFDWWTLVKLLPIFGMNVLGKLLVALYSRRWSFFGLLQSYVWLVFHPHVIYNKRRALRQERRVDEREIIQKMSGRLFNDQDVFARLLNACVLWYCRLVGLKTIEFTSNR